MEFFFCCSMICLDVHFFIMLEEFGGLVGIFKSACECGWVDIGVSELLVCE